MICIGGRAVGVVFCGSQYVWRLYVVGFLGCYYEHMGSSQPSLGHATSVDIDFGPPSKCSSLQQNYKLARVKVCVCLYIYSIIKLAMSNPLPYWLSPSILNMMKTKPTFVNSAENLGPLDLKSKVKVDRLKVLTTQYFQSIIAHHQLQTICDIFRVNWY